MARSGDVAVVTARRSADLERTAARGPACSTPSPWNCGTPPGARTPCAPPSSGWAASTCW
ncbi:hypothetical protein ACFQ60_45195 [Streptomyces zhihengii]